MTYFANTHFGFYDCYGHSNKSRKYSELVCHRIKHSNMTVLVQWPLICLNNFSEQPIFCRG